VALSPDFEAALGWAVRCHAEQRRHNTATPYVSHLLTTCAIVLEEGGDERLAIAALLHDVLEDTATSRDELRERFGAAVYQIVHDCTDADLGDRTVLDWRERKRSHVRRMACFSLDSLLVIAADKVSSLQSLVDDLVRFGPTLFDRSARSRRELLDNYRDVYAVLQPTLGDRPVVRRLAGLIGQLAATDRRSPPDEPVNYPVPKRRLTASGDGGNRESG
jgi:(p)ppGpp synthase/HD superfamily hydrolase